jgi:membrane protein implicated in regulation of membrane protease activity
VATHDDPVVGKLATVVHPIGEGKTGEVVVHIRGGTEVYMAVSDDDIAVGTEVVVIGQVSARTVLVTPFTATQA